MHIELGILDYLIIIIYFVFVLGIGFLIKRTVKTSNDFLMSDRSIPLWITSLAFVSANLGAQELIGMGASGAKYGIMTSHFYWVGANSGHGISGRFYDAFLLRQPCAVGALNI